MTGPDRGLRLTPLGCGETFLLSEENSKDKPLGFSLVERVAVNSNDKRCRQLFHRITLTHLPRIWRRRAALAEYDES